MRIHDVFGFFPRLINTDMEQLMIEENEHRFFRHTDAILFVYGDQKVIRDKGAIIVGHFPAVCEDKAAMALFILIIVFSMSINERKREFALLRTLGASKPAVAGIVMMEGVFAGLMGSIIGIIVSLAVLFGFGDLIENILGLPFLLPNGGFLALFSLVCALAVMVFSALSNIIAGRRVVKGDAGNLLREVD